MASSTLEELEKIQRALEELLDLAEKASEALGELFSYAPSAE